MNDLHHPRLAWLATAIVLALPILPLRAQVQAKAALDSSRILIGDQLRLRLTIEHPPEVAVVRVGWDTIQQVEGVEVLQPGTLDTIPSGGASVLLQQEMLITAFDSGYHRLPPIPVDYLEAGRAGRVTTAELGMEVGTFPIRSDTASLAPIKTIIEEPLAFGDLLPYLAGVAGVALLVALIVWLVRRRGAVPAEAPPPDPRPAHEVALESLDALRREKLWQQDRIKAYYSRLTYILRRFLEDRFQLPALESTTAETAVLLERRDLEAAWKDDLLRLFRTADAVKFAKAHPPADTHGPWLDRAEELVRAVIPPPVPEGEEGQDGNLAEG